MITYSASTIVQQEFDNGSTSATQDGLKDALVAAGWTLTNSSGGYTLRSAKTPQGLACTVRIQTVASQVTVTFNTVDAALSFLPNYISVSPSRRLKIIANKYQFFTFLQEGAGVIGTAVMGGVPSIHPHHQSIAISAITFGSPVQIDTAVAHGLVDGQSLFISDVEGTGVSSINSNWTVQVVNSTRLRLLTSNISGTWTSGTGYVAGPGKISRLIWSMADSNGSAVERACLRNSIYPTSGRNMYNSVALNQLTWNLNGSSGAGRPGIILPPYGVRWFNNQYINCEPYFVFGTATSGSTPTVNAQLWDAVAVNFGFTGDLNSIFDGHTWLNYTGIHPTFEQNGALFLAVN